MCLFTNARIVAIVFARSAGSEAMYCAGVLTFDGGFTDSVLARRFRRGLMVSDCALLGDVDGTEVAEMIDNLHGFDLGDFVTEVCDQKADQFVPGPRTVG